MAEFTAKKLNINDINNGQEWSDGQTPNAETFNAPIKSALWTEALATNQPDNSEADNIGVPNVSIIQANDGSPKLKFSNLRGIQGVQGDKGDSAFIRYSAYFDGTDFTETWTEGQTYVGFATGQTAPTDKSEYTWIYILPVVPNYYKHSISATGIDENGNPIVGDDGEPIILFRGFEFIYQDSSEQTNAFDLMQKLNENTIFSQKIVILADGSCGVVKNIWENEEIGASVATIINIENGSALTIIINELFDDVMGLV